MLTLPVLIIIGLLAGLDVLLHWQELRAGYELVPRCPRCDGMRSWRHKCPDVFVELTEKTMPRLGGVYDITRKDGWFSFWHVTVEEEPRYWPKPGNNLCDEWMEFKVTDGKFSASLENRDWLIREVPR